MHKSLRPSKPYSLWYHNFRNSDRITMISTQHAYTSIACESFRNWSTSLLLVSLLLEAAFFSTRCSLLQFNTDYDRHVFCAFYSFFLLVQLLFTRMELMGFKQTILYADTSGSLSQRNCRNERKMEDAAGIVFMAWTMRQLCQNEIWVCMMLLLHCTTLDWKDIVSVEWEPRQEFCSDKCWNQIEENVVQKKKKRAAL